MKKIKEIKNRKTHKGTELGSKKNDNSIRERSSVWPEKHEEQRSMDIRMKEQPFPSSAKPKVGNANIIEERKKSKAK